MSRAGATCSGAIQRTVLLSVSPETLQATVKVPGAALLPIEVHVEKTDTEVFTLFNFSGVLDPLRRALGW